MRFAKRLDAVPPYLFAELERKIAQKRREGVDVISLGIGDPDLPTPPAVVDALAEAARDPRTHQYPTNHGSDEFREAAAGFYRERFGVELDPGYPPYTSGPLFSGAEVHYLPLRAERGFLPELEAIPADVLARANLLFLDYPNNPTGAVVEPGYFERAVELARANDLVVVHDNAYSELCYGGYRAPSFLETPGAKEVGVEIFSLSKGWNMTGWRAGLVVGNADVVERYRQLKTNLDSGMFEAVQHATAVALTAERDFPREMSAVYERRRDLLAEALAAIGLDVDPPQATPYFWVRVPDGHDSASFSELVLEQAGVVVSPGPSFGPSGEGFVRLSLTVPDERLEEAARRIESSLRSGIIQA